jgi:hypothetical protein
LIPNRSDSRPNIRRLIFIATPSGLRKPCYSWDRTPTERAMRPPWPRAGGKQIPNRCPYARQPFVVFPIWILFFRCFKLAVAIRGIRDVNGNKRREVPTPEEAVMKAIPLSSIMEFQLKSQKTVRGIGFAESAVWAVFAASSAITVVLSLSQISPPSVQPSSPNSCSVVWDQQNTQPLYPLQTI